VCSNTICRAPFFSLALSVIEESTYSSFFCFFLHHKSTVSRWTFWILSAQVVKPKQLPPTSTVLIHHLYFNIALWSVHPFPCRLTAEAKLSWTARSSAMDQLIAFDAILFPSDGRPPHLVALMTSPMSVQMQPASSSGHLGRLPHPEHFMSFVAEGLGPRAWKYQVRLYYFPLLSVH
jgi:hypothetical protein